MTPPKTKPSSERIYAFDLAESIAILMACSLHYPLFIEGSILAEIWQLLCIGAVPSFFMINGCLLFSRPFSGRKHLRRIVTIILGLMFWKGLILLVFALLGHISLTDISATGFLRYIFTSDHLGVLPTAHTWFMYALIACYLVFPFFKAAYDHGYKNYIAYFCLLGIALMPLATDLGLLVKTFYPESDFATYLESIMYSLFPLSPWGWCIVFFLMGPIVWNGIVKARNSFGHAKLALLACLILLVGVGIAWVQDWMYQGSWAWTGAVLPLQYQHIATSIVAIGILALCACAPFKTESFRSFVQLFSSNTLTIYYIHMPILLLLTLHWPFGSGFAISLGRVLAVAAIGLAVGVIMKKTPVLKRIA